MKGIKVSAVLWIGILAVSVFANVQGTSVFYGEISDSQCALNVHSLTRSHQEMLKSKSMGGTPAECSLYCVQHMGGRFVLSSKKDVYHLDNQGLARKFVGQKVKLTGNLDRKTGIIEVTNIEPEK